MKNNKEQWIDEVMESRSGMERVKPKSDLFKKIENRINGLEGEVIPMRRFRFMAAAAVLLLTINIVGVSYYFNQQSDADNLAYEDYYGTDVFFTDNNNVYSN